MPQTPPPPNLPTQPSQAQPPDSDISYHVMPNYSQTSTEELGLSDQSSQPQSGGRRRIVYLAIAGAVVLVILGIGIYLLSNKKDSPPQQQQATRLPKVWLMQYFGSEVCSNTETCGDLADPDKDGLSNLEEFKEGANPIINDTDGDGLADGDEVLIYKTDPVLKFTDRREVASELGYTDGVQVKNSYDPLTPGIKFTDVRKQQIENDTQKYKLHEPTTTTLTLQAQNKTVSVLIENNKFNPEIVSINIGDTVVWTNQDQAKHHLASNPHPTHTDIPGFESADLVTNQTYSFKFTKTGSFGYHDHLNPTSKGMITVQ